MPILIFSQLANFGDHPVSTNLIGNNLQALLINSGWKQAAFEGSKVLHTFQNLVLCLINPWLTLIAFCFKYFIVMFAE